LILEEDGRCREARLAYCGAGEGPVLARLAAATLRGGRLGADDIAAAGGAAAGEIPPYGGIHAGSRYPPHLARVLAREAFAPARDGAGQPDHRWWAMTAEQHDIVVTVNGRRCESRIEGRLLLSDFIRHNLRLPGTHVGCEHGVCGACTVLYDGEPVRSCLMF